MHTTAEPNRTTTREGIVRHGLRFFLVLLMLLPGPTKADTVQQFDTRYFTIIFDEDGEYTAGEIARFCDDVYEDLMALYGAFTDDPRVVCIVNDAVDLANGYAVQYENTITIYATNMDFELRGQSAWLRNVFTHEMTHMIALKKTANGPVNFVFLSGGKYNKNPDFDVNLYWYHLSQPAWFSEGTAQLGAETYGPENWDTHRDMLLRSAWLDGSLLSLPEMNTLEGHTSIGGEMVYNQGYSLVGYIRDTYGYDTVVALNNVRTLTDFAPTIRQVLGISAQELYDDWLESLADRYESFRGRSFITGEEIVDRGSADYYPALSPDGRYLAFLSNRGGDYTITDLMLMDISTGKVRKIVEEVDYRISWSHDSARLAYVKRPEGNQRFYDIFTFEVASGTERRVSKSLRARDPSFSPGDSLIVFVRNARGQNQLGVIDADGSNCRYLTATTDGTQFYTPSFSPDGEHILFSIFRQDSDRDIALIDASGQTYRHGWDQADSTSGFADSTLFARDSGFTLLLGSSADERDPRFTPDGTGVVYVSDRTGVFNVYRLDPATGRTTRITDCPGGAFAPMAGTDGNVYYAGYTADDFSIYRIDLNSRLDSAPAVVEPRDYLTQLEPFDISDYFTVTPYQQKRVLNAIVPTVRAGPSFIGSQFGLDVIDMGAQVYLSDVLGYDTLMFGGSVGKNIREEVDYNNEFFVAYERSLVPFTSSRYAHSPRLFAEASRVVINNLIGRYRGVADSVIYGDIPELGYENVLQDLHQTLVVDDEYRDEFRRARVGVVVPLTTRHSLQLDAGYREYRETLNRIQVYRDFSSFFVDGTDITETVDGTQETYTDEFRYFTDMDYFTSVEFGLSYLYSRSEPAADNDLAPKGTACLIQMRHLRSAITDSLVDQPQFYAPLYISYNGNIQLSEYNPDPYADQLRPLKRNTDLNEYLVILQENRRLPWWRHTLDIELIGAYRDIKLKDVNRGEGSGYNWPLKYYLGGGSMLSGYPYFAFSGTKLAYSRIGYTFPIIPRIAKDIVGIQVQKLYGSVFFEAANVWNFKKLSMDNLAEGHFKRDICFELRLGAVTFYRIPAIAYGRIAWPLDGMGDSPYENDARRLYFGLRM